MSQAEFIVITSVSPREAVQPTSPISAFLVANAAELFVSSVFSETWNSGTTAAARPRKTDETGSSDQLINIVLI